MQKTLIYHQEKCVGCRSCVVGCSLYHEGEVGKVLSRINILKNEVVGENFIAGCNQCSDAPCVAACPTGACHKDVVTGFSKVNPDKCIGCKECAIHCPFGAITMHPKTAKAFKCDLCEGRAEGPICVDWCPAEAITFETPAIAVKGFKRQKVEARVKAAIKTAQEV
jgi:Fe-S-cluster-containing hydrogenase component 2